MACSSCQRLSSSPHCSQLARSLPLCVGDVLLRNMILYAIKLNVEQWGVNAAQVFIAVPCGVLAVRFQ